jgi:hypothetical protein
MTRETAEAVQSEKSSSLKAGKGGAVESLKIVARVFDDPLSRGAEGGDVRGPGDFVEAAGVGGHVGRVDGGGAAGGAGCSSTDLEGDCVAWFDGEVVDLNGVVWPPFKPCVGWSTGDLATRGGDNLTGAGLKEL